jgi:hypothetical protein
MYRTTTANISTYLRAKGSAADRDALLLQSQLEPWSTTALRRRLVSDFGAAASEADPALVERPELMKRLVARYALEASAEASAEGSAGASADPLANDSLRTVEEGTETEAGATAVGVSAVSAEVSARIGAAAMAGAAMGAAVGAGGRVVVKVSGAPVGEAVLAALRVQLRLWVGGAYSSGVNRERPTILAESYMILRSPAEFLRKPGSMQAQKAATKLKKYQCLWDLARQAMLEVDPDFADRYTALAVTNGFQGSPHIDKQNIGPFYGLALGSFTEGQGGIMVECSARVVAHVNTRNRLGKVDGRYPHWLITAILYAH